MDKITGTLTVWSNSVELAQASCTAEKLEAAAQHYQQLAVVTAIQWFSLFAETTLVTGAGGMRLARAVRITYLRNEHGLWQRFHSSELEDGCPHILSKEERIAFFQKQQGGPVEGGGFDA